MVRFASLLINLQPEKSIAQRPMSAAFISCRKVIPGLHSNPSGTETTFPWLATI